jgi:uncharacterized protein (TIGR00725 family)
MGSGSDAHEPTSSQLGRWLAEEGVHLLTGGGGGVMAAVSRAFHETAGRKGLVIGVIPCAEDDPARPKRGYPNDWVEVPILTHLPHSGTRGTEPTSRNHINVLTADALIALPGGAGTESEIALAVRYGRPIVVFTPERREGEPPAGVACVARFDELQAFVRKLLAR